MTYASIKLSHVQSDMYRNKDQALAWIRFYLSDKLNVNIKGTLSNIQEFRTTQHMDIFWVVVYLIFEKNTYRIHCICLHHQ